MFHELYIKSLIIWCRKRIFVLWKWVISDVSVIQKAIALHVICYSLKRHTWRFEVEIQYFNELS